MLRVTPLTRRVTVPHLRLTSSSRARQLVSAFSSLAVRAQPRRLSSATPATARLLARGSASRASADPGETAVVAEWAEGESPTASPAMAGDGCAKLAALRARMAAASVDAFVVPSQDPHFSEYVPTCFERRAWISGFTGSAGTAVVTAREALLWTDGRYFLQASQELSSEWTLMKGGQPGVPEPKQWLAEKLPSGARVGVDASVHSLNEARAMRDVFAKHGVALECLATNPVDEAWGDARPPFPTAPLRAHPAEWAGKTAAEKIAECRAALAEKDADALVVSPLDEVAWLFNVRGNDLDFNPVALGYGLITQNAATLYVDRSKVSDALRAELKAAGVDVAAYEACVSDVKALAAAGKSLWVDPEKVSAALVAAAEDAAADAAAEAPSSAKKAKTEASGEKKTRGANKKKTVVVEGASPIPLAKAIKNDAEIAGMVEAHLRDGVAMASFWCWLDKQAREGKTHSEFEIGEVVRSFRAKQPGFSEESFATIAGEGPHGAVIHYRATRESARVVGSDSLLLCDSGGQYECGTTDVTRTHHTGSPTAFQKDAYTRVLQGHIALASARFPEDTCGFVLDAFARSHLWAEGLDYRHGTGHGVGAALNVHEGPQSVSPRFGNPTPLRPGMVLSNEPGYYEDGPDGFGIRIENLLVVRQAATSHTFGDKKYLEFYPLTLIPIQKKLIDWSLMAPKDVAWLNEYHAQVWERVSPRVEDEETKAWLRDATKPVTVRSFAVVSE